MSLPVKLSISGQGIAKFRGFLVACCFGLSLPCFVLTVPVEARGEADSLLSTVGAPIIGKEWPIFHEGAFGSRSVHVLQTHSRNEKDEYDKHRFLYVPPLSFSPNHDGSIFTPHHDGLTLTATIVWDPYPAQTFNVICNYLMTAGAGGNPVFFEQLPARGSFKLGKQQIARITVTDASFKSDPQYGVNAQLTQGDEFRFSEHKFLLSLRGTDSDQVNRFVQDFENGTTSLTFKYSFHTVVTARNYGRVGTDIYRKLEEFLEVDQDEDGPEYRSLIISRDEWSEFIQRIGISSSSTVYIEDWSNFDPDAFTRNLQAEALNLFREAEAEGQRIESWNPAAFKGHVTNNINGISNTSDQNRFLLEFNEVMSEYKDIGFRDFLQTWGEILGLGGGGTTTGRRIDWEDGQSAAEALRVLKEGAKATSKGHYFSGDWLKSQDVDFVRLDNESMEALLETVVTQMEAKASFRRFTSQLTKDSLVPPPLADPDPSECPAYEPKSPDPEPRSIRSISTAMGTIWRGQHSRDGKSIFVSDSERERLKLGRGRHVLELDSLVIGRKGQFRITVGSGGYLDLTVRHMVLGGRLVIDADGRGGDDGDDGRDGSLNLQGTGYRGRNGRDGAPGADGGTVVVRAGIVAPSVAPNLGLPSVADQLSRISIDVDGGDGGDGGHGGDGGRGGPNTCYFDRDRADGRWQYAQNGGRGGIGGNGGEGGDAGSVTARFWPVVLSREAERALIDKRGRQSKAYGVKIRARGGDGGRGGEGGRGGHPGRNSDCCFVVCVSQTPGASGVPGSPGRNGSGGNSGSIDFSFGPASDWKGMQRELDEIGERYGRR